MQGVANGRLSRLLRFLEVDPLNVALANDTASAALDARRPDVARGVLERFEAQAALPPSLLNVKALAALAEERFADAAETLEALQTTNPEDPALRFNLAWARTMTGAHQAAADLIGTDVVAASPRAAALKVQALHHLGDLGAALAWGAECLEALPDDRDLLAALAVVALDADQPELARAYAERAGPTHEGFSNLGMLALNDEYVDDSAALFDKALEANPNSARGLLGKGLTQMLAGENAEAAAALDRSAEVFGDHLGTWVTAGWAHYAAGDLATARARFETALALDDTFAETHGALAVMDIMAGDLDSARRRADVALRLDRECLSAALARSLLLTAEGKAEAGERVRRIAMNLPVGPDGKTISQAMATLGARIPPRRVG
jgi:tetratricopeptide (TPR) repeat protein